MDEFQPEEQLQPASVYYDAVTVIQLTKEEEEWRQCAYINGREVELKIDSGAKMNTLPEEIAKKVGCFKQMRPSSIRLVSYGKFFWVPKGEIEAHCRIGQETKKVTFLVVDKGLTPLLCLGTSLDFGLVARRHPEQEARQTPDMDPVESIPGTETSDLPNTREELVRQHPEIFEGIGKMPGEVELHVEGDAKPHVCPPIRLPLKI